MVEQSALSARKTLERLGVPRATFYRWYDQYRTDGPEALEDRPSRPSHVWNRIPEEIRSRIVELALEQTELSPRELAVQFTDTQGYLVSEATVYRLLKAHDLITLISTPTGLFTVSSTIGLSIKVDDFTVAGGSRFHLV